MSTRNQGVEITKRDLKGYIDHQKKGLDPNFYRWLKQNGLKRQFIDAPPELSPAEYARFLKSIRSQYLATFPAEQILMGNRNPFIGLGHLPQEINEPIFGDLSIKQIYEILHSIDCEDIMRIIGVDITNIQVSPRLSRIVSTGDGKIEIRRGGEIKITGEKDGSEVQGIQKISTQRRPELIEEEIILYRRFESKPRLYDDSEIVPERAVIQSAFSINNVNAYQVLYNSEGLPIGTVIGTINAATLNYATTFPVDGRLADEIHHAKENKKILVRKNIAVE